MCIDTPETRKRVGDGWEYDPAPYAVKAKKYNESLVGGKNVRLGFDVEKIDKYNRLLAYVYVDGKMVNEELLRRGYALVTPYPPNIKYISRLVEAEDEARRHKKGLWGGIKKISAGEAYTKIGEICIIKGKCLNVTFARHAVLLNFSKTEGNEFTAVIHTSNLSFFEQVGINPEQDYRGKQVEMIGRIKGKKSPQIRIYHPSQIKIIQ